MLLKVDLLGVNLLSPNLLIPNLKSPNLLGGDLLRVDLLRVDLPTADCQKLIWCCLTLGGYFNCSLNFNWGWVFIRLPASGQSSC